MAAEGVQATEISAGVTADTSQAEAQVQSLGQRLVGVARTSSNALASIGRGAGGEANFLAPVSQALYSITAGLDLVALKSGPAATGLEKIGKTGQMLMGVGVAIAGIGLMLQGFAGPLQNANALITTAVNNTGHSMDELTAKGNTLREEFDASMQAGQKYGYSMADVGNALGKLTAQTKDPIEALKELRFAETLAAAAGVSVGRAAEMIGRMHAGQFRYLRQFGIYIQNINTNHLDTVTATKRVEDAQRRLQDTQQKVSDFEARMSEKRAKASQDWGVKVSDATQKAQDAQQHYAELHQRLTDQEAEEQAKYADAVERAKDRVISAEEAVQNARDREVETESNLNDLRAKFAAEDQDRAEAKAEALDNESRSVQDAETHLRTLAREQAARGQATTPEEEIRRADELKRAQEGVTHAKEKLTDLQNKSLASHTQELTRTQEIEKAQDAIAKAKQDEEKQADNLVKAQNDQNKVTREHVLVLDRIAAQRSEEARALEGSQRAQEHLNLLQQKAAEAMLPTLQEKQEERRLREAVEVETGKERDAQDKLNVSKNIEAELQKRFQTAEDAFMARFDSHKKLLDERAKTNAGSLRSLRAHIVNILADIGQHGNVIATIGGLIGGAGIMMQMGRMVTGLGKMAGQVRGVVGAAGEAGTLVGTMEGPGIAAAGAAEATAGASGGIVASLGGLLAAIAPIALVVAAIAALAAIGYVVYRNWDTISGFFTDLWDSLFSFGRRVFNEFWDFLFKWGPLIVEVLMVPFTGGMSLILPMIIQHWGDIESFFASLPEKVWGFFTDAADWLVTSGENLIIGLINGIANKVGDLWTWVEGIGKDLVHKVTHPWELLSPSKVMFRAGDNLIQGLILGMQNKERDLAGQADKISKLGLPDMGGSVTGGASSLLPDYSLPGSGGTGIVTAGQQLQIVNLNLSVEGSVIGQKELFNQFRDWMIQKGKYQGGNVLGAGTAVV